MRAAFRRVVLAWILTGAALLASAQTPQPAAALDPKLNAAVDAAAAQVLAASKAPSVSVAIVSHGRLAYARAYGDAKVEPPTAATPAMRYSIGSVSKQFTATAVLMLAEEGKLSLDDPVSRFLPELTRAKDVKIRQLLSHTSGYRDYWPQDYVPPFMRTPATAESILTRWAKQPLDFEPGSQYQYSNTGYVAAGEIVEKASGTPLLDLLRKRIFEPLEMRSVTDVDRGRLTESDPTGYVRYGLGPQRTAPKEGPGWLFAAGELAMTPSDLAKWNVAMIERRMLKPASYAEMWRDVLLTNGVGAGYGLGLDVGLVSGHRAVWHGGEVSGFVTSNIVFPDDGAAVTVAVNQDANDVPGELSGKIVKLLFEDRDGAAASEARARRILESLQRGTVDRSLFTDNANAYFDEAALRDFAAGLGALGAISKVELNAQRERGGMTYRGFDVTFAKGKAALAERDMPDGKIEQFQVNPAQ
ncbi:MAG TPA: serine hydrolase domain-containing protein [Thermoanaerobaculia bacterium]|nr:serine hydrolase domain-containing protein [Thermoanaerobaculia bacterium]